MEKSNPSGTSHRTSLPFAIPLASLWPPCFLSFPPSTVPAFPSFPWSEIIFLKCSFLVLRFMRFALLQISSALSQHTSCKGPQSSLSSLPSSLADLYPSLSCFYFSISPVCILKFVNNAKKGQSRANWQCHQWGHSTLNF